jgi:16S rRNA (cytosine1402-N4)-methyltransferase
MQKKTRKSYVHEPVLVDEILDLLQVEKFAHLKSQATFIDATLGNAGHSVEFVKKGINVLGIDIDAKMIEFAKKQLEQVHPSHLSRKVGDYKIVHGNFKNIKRIAHKHRLESVEGILFDLGVSTHQLMSKVRGMSFAEPEALLDMRLGYERDSVMAKDILNLSSKGDLVDIFSVTCDFIYARKLVAKVINRRKERSFEKVGDFLNITKNLRIGKKSELHPATLPFLALRMRANNELENLTSTLPQAIDLLVKGGRLAVISFHSGEDGIIKNSFKDMDMRGIGNIVTKKPVVPTEREIKMNPKSRSAKLRVIERSM